MTFQKKFRFSIHAMAIFYHPPTTATSGQYSQARHIVKIFGTEYLLSVTCNFHFCEDANNQLKKPVENRLIMCYNRIIGSTADSSPSHMMTVQYLFNTAPETEINSHFCSSAVLPLMFFRWSESLLRNTTHLDRTSILLI